MDAQLVIAGFVIIIVAAIISAVIGLVYRSVKACLGCATLTVVAVVLAAVGIYVWRMLGS